jgi:hypothetical protein
VKGIGYLEKYDFLKISIPIELISISCDSSTLGMWLTHLAKHALIGKLVFEGHHSSILLVAHAGLELCM